MTVQPPAPLPPPVIDMTVQPPPPLPPPPLPPPVIEMPEPSVDQHPHKDQHPGRGKGRRRDSRSAGSPVDLRSSSSETTEKRPRLARILSRDAQEIIVKVYEKEMSTPKQHSKPGRTRDNVAKILGGAVSAGSVKKVWDDHQKRVLEALAEGKDNTVRVSVPEPKPDKRNRPTKYNSRHLSYLAHCINTMVYDENMEQLPSLMGIFERVHNMREEFARRHHCNTKDVFDFGYGTFHKMMGHLGYSHESDRDDREATKNQEYVLQQRDLYLKKIARLRAQGYTILHQDETWVNKNTTKKKSWMREDGAAPAGVAVPLPTVLRPEGKKKPIGKGGSAIVIGIGSSQHGTIGELLEVFVGKKSGQEEDYHKEMDATMFEGWWNKVLRWIKDKLPDQKVAVVLDNASYHTRAYPHTLVPTMSKTNEEIINWMRKYKEVPPQLLPGYIDPQEVNMQRLVALEAGEPFEYVWVPMICSRPTCGTTHSPRSNCWRA